MILTPTAEQAAILSAFTDGKDLVIQAGAGTGKTTTLKMLAQTTDALGTYLAFNKRSPGLVEQIGHRPRSHCAADRRRQHPGMDGFKTRPKFMSL